MVNTPLNFFLWPANVIHYTPKGRLSAVQIPWPNIVRIHCYPQLRKHLQQAPSLLCPAQAKNIHTGAQIAWVHSCFNTFYQLSKCPPNISSILLYEPNALSATQQLALKQQYDIELLCYEAEPLLKQRLQHANQQFFYRRIDRAALISACPKQSLYRNPQYNNLIKQLITQYQITTYYAIDPVGSYLFKNQQGDTWWLIIRHQEHLNSEADYLKHLDHLNADQVIQVQCGLKIPFFPCDYDSTISCTSANPFLLVAHPVKGVPHYFYALMPTQLSTQGTTEHYAESRASVANCLA